MSIQADIIETIGTDGIEVNALRQRFGNIGSNELYVAVNALLRARRVRVVADRYEVVPSTRPLGEMSHTGRPPSAQEEAEASLRPLSGAPTKRRQAGVTVNGTEALKVGRRAVAPVSTPLVAGSSPAGSTISYSSPAASTHPIIADRVFERVKAQRQMSLNKVALLDVQLANERSKISECDTFLEMYARFAEGAA